MQHKIYVLFILGCYFLYSNSTTHWFLNRHSEDKIQAQMDSIYQLRRPYDFLALIQQEQRAKQVEQLKKELIKQKSHIDKNEDKDTHLEERIYRTHTDCILAGRPLTEFDLYASNTLDLKLFGINVEDYLINDLSNIYTYETPDCKAAIDLPFSMFTLEHLKGVQLKNNLSSLPEDYLSILNGEDKPDKWGHQVAMALKRNGTSWLLHTLASQFWRVKGISLEAIECIRRAIYLSKREHRHIPLFHFGALLHRGRESEDSAVILHMALDHYRHSAAIHHLLGCIYATVGFYNESVTCLENALHISPKNEDLVKLKHAVLCHAHLEGALEKQLQSLQHTLNELRAYQKKHDEWLSLQQKLLLEQATPEMKLEARLEYEEQKIRESVDGRGQDCFQYQQDGHTFLSCNMRRDQLEQQSSSAELLLDLQSLLRSVESETMRLGQQVLKRKPAFPSTVPAYVSPLVPHHNDKPKAAISGNPSKIIGANCPTWKECHKAPPLPEWDAFPTVVLPFEKKGIHVQSYIDNVEIDYEEYLPPLCEPSEETIPQVDDLAGVKERHSSELRYPDEEARWYLNEIGLSLDQSDAELKIAHFLKEESSPKWVFYNVAGLYWRAEGDVFNGIECLRNALVESPSTVSDVALVSLASLLYQSGHIDDALVLTLKALEVNDSEVETNFFIANLFFGKGNLTGAWHHYEKVLALAPNHSRVKQYLTALACHTRNDNSPLSHCTTESYTGDEDCFGSIMSDHESLDTVDVESDNQCTSDDELNFENYEKRGSNKEIRIKIGVESDSASSPSPGLGLEDDVLPDVLLRVKEKVFLPAMPPHLCDRSSQFGDVKHFTSTWLSVSAKNIEIGEYLVSSPKEGVPLEEPICEEDFPSSMHTLDHLSGMKNRALLPHYPELGLKEAFQTLTEATPQPMDLVATRIARSLKKNETSWVIATAAALYWRVLGNGHRAVDCLRQALHYSPRNMKDIPLISLANIFHRSGLLNTALIVGNMALEISPNFVVIHFTMANIYAAKGDYDKAVSFYQLTLSLQSTFEPARDRLRVIQCSLSNNNDPKL